MRWAVGVVSTFIGGIAGPLIAIGVYTWIGFLPAVAIGAVLQIGGATLYQRYTRDSFGTEFVEEQARLIFAHELVLARIGIDAVRTCGDKYCVAREHISLAVAEDAICPLCAGNLAECLRRTECEPPPPLEAA